VATYEAESLVAAARRGDRAALDELVRDTSTEVWRFLAHLVDPQSADDLTQETYLRALGALGAFRGASSLRTWLLSIARRVAADEIRRRSRRPRTGGELPQDTPDALDLPGEVSARDLLQRLDPARREAFVLTQITGLSYAEAAELANCPIGTIRSRVARARDDLAAMVDGSRDGADRPQGERAQGERPA
jgi:RNA polymerase sigma-70 factor, ECF subfamily